MPDEETTEPTNQQLARFLVVYGKHIPALADLQLNEVLLERMMERNPAFREAGLRHHAQFQEDLNKLQDLMKAGKLQCEGRTKKGKRCPNRNEPGSFYCGLHKDQEETLA